tara:strand:- start:26473 stop:27138 length:666 start_codon:yes stop_codon:yes gene_type:complete
MITVHHLENSRSMRILWLLEELGTEYEVKTYKRDPKTNLAPPDYQKLHPLGKAPIVTDGSKTLAETGAIVEHFLDKFPNSGLRPDAGTPQRQSYYYWMHASEGSLMNLLVLGLFMSRMETTPPFPINKITSIVTGKIRDLYLTPSLTRMYEFMNDELGRTPWFAGETVTGADIMMSYPVEAAHGRAGLDKTYPNVMAWLDRLHERPAYQRAVAKGGELETL